MKIYNTLTRQKEEFVPVHPGKVGMYVCGPTVYNYIHIGNARPMIIFDTVRRYFEYKGYEVNYVSNFTDVDDKIIKKANEEGVTATEIAERYIKECKQDMEALNIKPATHQPRATEEIGGMIKMIQTLIKKGHAYEVDGTVYFKTRSFKDYGKLSKKNIDDLEAGHREIKVTGEEGKKDPLDFVLWKPKKEGEPAWKSPWGEGRPGWHIECTAMIMNYLGETIDIVDHQGKWLARGAYSPASQIRARVWTFDPNESIDIAFFTRRLQQAQKWRDWLAQKDGLDSYRLIAGESDGLPGITIDRFGNFLVLQLLSAGAEYQRAALISALQTLYPECAIYDRSDVAVRKKEGMELTQGPVTGELPPALLPIEEHGMKLLVDIQHGHKTGYYLDQRDSRLATRRYVENKRVLNCFSYTGGFAVSALMGGCSQVVSVDTSQEALDIARQNVELNKLDLSKAEFVRDDVFKLLRTYRDRGEKFDVIVMDPPKFVENKSQLMGACRGYKDINMLAIQLLNEGGILLTFSCSGLMTSDLFQKIIADAAIDAGRDVQFIEQFRQAADHPVIATYPEGLYLKGFACRVM